MKYFSTYFMVFYFVHILENHLDAATDGMKHRDNSSHTCTIRIQIFNKLTLAKRMFCEPKPRYVQTH